MSDNDAHTLLDWNKKFHVHTDASLYAIGSVLVQEGRSRSPHFASRRLTAADKNDNATEGEGLAMVYSLQKFQHEVTRPFSISY